MSLFSKLILLTNLEHLADILILLLLGKFISEIHEHRISSNKRHPLISAAPLGIHIEISASPFNKCCTSTFDAD